MNTLNGYSKSTLTDSNVLSAAGGHLPLVAGRLWESWTSVTIEEANVVWYIKVELPGYSKPSSMLIYGSYNNIDDLGLVEFSGFSKGYIYRNINQNTGNVVAICMSSVYDSTTKKWTFWIKMRPINNSSDYYAPDLSATYLIYFSESYTITATATTTDPGVEWQPTSSTNLVIKNADLIGTATTATTATTAVSANKIPVTQNTNTDAEWPIVWSNQNNSNTATANLLYKSYNLLTYNPSKQRISVNNLWSTSGVLTINSGTDLYLKRANDDTKSLVLNSTSFKPFDSANAKLDLGSASAKWKNIYANNLLNIVNKAGGTDLGMIVEGSSNKIGFIIGTGNVNRGLYDYTNAKWVLLKDASTTYINDWTGLGSSTTPVYFSGGKPVACTYSLNKTVPSNAVFTDTSYAKYVSYLLPATEGWYRIASSAESVINCVGLFQIIGTLSGYHTVFTMSAGTSYNTEGATNLTILATHHYKQKALSKVRIVYKTDSWSGLHAYLEVYNAGNLALNLQVKMIDGTGWTLNTASSVGSIPSGYVGKEYILTDGVVISDTLKAKKAEIDETLCITSTTGNKYILMGNQDGNGVNKPFIMRASNGGIEFACGDSWENNGGNLTIFTKLNENNLETTNKVRIRKDLGGNLSQLSTYLHNGPLEVGRSSNTMCLALGVTDDNYGYIQSKGNSITNLGDLVLQPNGGTLVYGSSKYPIIHSNNYTGYTVKKDGTGANGTWGINISGSATKLSLTSVTTYNNLTPEGVIVYENTNGTLSSNGAGFGNTSAALAWGKSNCKVMLSARAGKNDSEVYIRQYYTSWGNWYKLIHSGNLSSYVDLSSYATQTYVDTAIANAQLDGSNVTIPVIDVLVKTSSNPTLGTSVVLNKIATIDLSGYAKLTDIPTSLPADGGLAESLIGYTFKTLSSQSHSGWTNNTTDSKIIPTMSFIAYWNGAVGSNGASNLLYCTKGAFGDAAVKGVTTSVTSDSANPTNAAKLITSGGVYNYINSFSGINKTGTVTSVTVTGANGLSGSGTITTSGTITLSNSGVRSVSSGSTNGTISVNTNGTSAEVAVKGLGSNAYSSTAYLPLTGGTLSGAITFSNTSPITWNSGSYHQRINITDDAVSGTEVFTFQQSSDTGSTWKNLVTIRDTGTLSLYGSSACTYLQGLKDAQYSAIDIATSPAHNLYSSWIRQTLANNYYVSLGTSYSSLHFVGSQTSTTSNTPDSRFEMCFNAGFFKVDSKHTTPALSNYISFPTIITSGYESLTIATEQTTLIGSASDCVYKYSSLQSGYVVASLNINSGIGKEINLVIKPSIPQWLCSLSSTVDSSSVDFTFNLEIWVDGSLVKTMGYYQYNVEALTLLIISRYDITSIQFKLKTPTTLTGSNTVFTLKPLYSRYIYKGSDFTITWKIPKIDVSYVVSNLFVLNISEVKNCIYTDGFVMTNSKSTTYSNPDKFFVRRGDNCMMLSSEGIQYSIDGGRVWNSLI